MTASFLALSNQLKSQTPSLGKMNFLGRGTVPYLQFTPGMALAKLTQSYLFLRGRVFGDGAKSSFLATKTGVRSGLKLRGDQPVCMPCC